VADAAAIGLGVGGSLLEGYLANKEATKSNAFNKSMIDWAKSYLTAVPEGGKTGYSVSEKANVLLPDFLSEALSEANVAGAKGQTNLAFSQGRSGTGDTGTSEVMRALGEAAPPIVARAGATGRAYNLASSLARSQASAFAGAPIPAPAQPFDLGPIFGALEAAYVGRGYGNSPSGTPDNGPGYGHSIGPGE
jgi:hypothetical protein